MILSATKNREQWIDIISKFPKKLQDIYFHPDYVSLNCNKYNSEGFLFYNIDGDKIWINPFIKIKIPSFFEVNDKSFYDLETAYGYGGPISNVLDPRFISLSNKIFMEWTNNNNIVSEFVRFHPLFDTKIYTDSNIEILDDRVTCSLELNKVNQEYSPFKSKIKNMLKRAKKETKFYISKERKHFSQFKKLYLNLMLDKNAEKETFFSKSYFAKLFDLILKNGFMSIIEDLQGNIIAIGVFLNGKESCHYHLSASKNYKLPGINNLLIYNAAIYAKKKNLNILHLGGGNLNNPKDNLFKFKNSMSTQNHIYNIGKRINNPALYKKFKNAWKKKYPILYEKYSKRLLCYHINTEIVDTCI